MSLCWQSADPDPKPETPLLTLEEVAALTNSRPDTLKFLALTGQGPEYVEVHGQPRYSLAAVQKWQRLCSAAHDRLMASLGRTEAQ